MAWLLLVFYWEVLKLNCSMKKEYLISRRTRTAARKITKTINPSISKVSKVAKGLGAAGVLFNGSVIGYNWYHGENVTASQVADLAIGVGLVLAGSLAIMSAPVALIAVGAYGILDAAGTFNRIKSYLGGDTVVLEGYMRNQ
ncbi:MAG: hypothetical protein AAGI25_20580 [Bacteroidota bacterium]